MIQKILVADDHDVSRRVVQATLASEGYSVDTARDGAEAWAKLQLDDAPELVVLDWNMPYMDGAEICRLLRARADRAYTYVLMLSARDACDDVASGLTAGADDYLPKPFHGPELLARVAAGVRVLDLQRRLIEAEARTRVDATHDALTEVWNRRGAIDLLEKELVRARRSGASLAVAILDVDHFKQINDSYGHARGDEVLRCVTRALRGAMRAYDEIGRIGGEEFLVVFPDCDVPSAIQAAERLRFVVEQCRCGETDLAVTVSGGVAGVSAESMVDCATLLEQADAALYRAKRGGRNRIEGPIVRASQFPELSFDSAHSHAR